MRAPGLAIEDVPNWVRYSEDCAQPIAAMFGCFLDSDLAHLAQVDLGTGKLRDCKRSPWMQQFTDDLAALVFVEGGSMFLEDLEERYAFLFTRNPDHEELQAIFVSLNVIELRAWKVSNSVPPPSCQTIDSSSTPMQVYKSIFVSTSERFTHALTQTQHATQTDQASSPPIGDIAGTAQSAADLTLYSCKIVSNGVMCGNALYTHVRFCHTMCVAESHKPHVRTLVNFEAVHSSKW